MASRLSSFFTLYSMIIWNCQKVNQSNSVLKPLPRLPNVPKVAYVWDILIFQAFWTSRIDWKISIGLHVT